MEEEELIKALFQKTDLSYNEEGIERAVLDNIRARPQKKPGKYYHIIGKTGLACCLLLSLLFILSSVDHAPQAENHFYTLLGAPFILLLLLLQLEFFTGKNGRQMIDV